MTEFVFKILESIGFHHPIHPAVTHLPMGMIMGGFLFGLAAYFLKNKELSNTAHYCEILAMIGVFPTIIFGYMDWQHSFEGEWIMLIKIKILLAVVLIGLLGLAIKFGGKKDGISIKTLIIYGLCLLTAIGLGFTGGELMYG